MRAGMIGASLVILAMFIVYRLTGFNAVLALVLNIVLVFGALAALNATLTLPGIAGIVLTIGMVVDANVLIFERIREELRGGRTVKSRGRRGLRKRPVVDPRCQLHDADRRGFPLHVRHRPDPRLRRHPLGRHLGLTLHVALREPLAFRPRALAQAARRIAVDLIRPAEIHRSRTWTCNS